MSTEQTPTAPPKHTAGLAIRFDGPPGPVAGRFVEAERDGVSIRIGEWEDQGDGTWLLVLGRAYAAAPGLLDACRLVIRSSVPDGEGGWHTPEKAADAVVAAVFLAIGEDPNTHQPSPTQDTGVHGDGLVPSAGRAGASSDTELRKHLAAQRAAWRVLRMIIKGLSDSGHSHASEHLRNDCEVVAKMITQIIDIEAASPDLLAACAPFDTMPDYEHLSDDVVVLTGNGSDGVYLKAGQVRAIKAAMARAEAPTDE